MIDRERTVPEHATIKACLEEGKSGFAVGQRLSLPFVAEPISVFIAKQTSLVGTEELITDFSPFNNKICIVEHADRMDVFVRHVGDLQERYGRWKGEIILTCCEKDADIFDTDNHIRLRLRFRDDEPTVRIEAGDTAA